jgi:hypothetical protein
VFNRVKANLTGIYPVKYLARDQRSEFNRGAISYELLTDAFIILRNKSTPSLFWTWGETPGVTWQNGTKISDIKNPFTTIKGLKPGAM